MLNVEEYSPAQEPDSSSNTETFGSACFRGLQKIEPEIKPVQSFDFEMLPAAFSGYVQDVAQRMSAPPDYVAVALMVSLSAVVGRKFQIHPKQKDNWLVVPNLWGCIIGTPSAKKSPTMSDALRIVGKLEGDAKTDYQDKQKAFEVDAELGAIGLKQAKKDASKLVDDGDSEGAKKRLTDAQAASPEPPIRKRYKVSDATVEKLGELLNENTNGLLLVRDELAGFISSLSKQGHENDRAFYLEAWAGNNGYTYDRIGRGTLDIKATTTSVVGGIQPAKIKPLIDAAVSGSQDDDGFIQRFQLAVWPEKVKDEYVDQYPDEKAEQRAFTVFERIANIEPDKPAFLRFDAKAQELFIEWFNDNCKKCEGDLLPAIESHLTKYKSMVPSLALLIHLADSHSVTTISPVSVVSLLKALAWTDYLESHMHKIYGMGKTTDQDNAINIAEKFGNQLNDSFTVRDVARANWKGIGTNKELALSAINTLIDYGYVAEENRQTIGRPTTDYLINPDAVGLHG